MKKNTRVPLDLGEEGIKNLDKVCKELNLSRPQVVRYLLSGDNQKIDLVVDKLKRVYELF